MRITEDLEKFDQAGQYTWGPRKLGFYSYSHFLHPIADHRHQKEKWKDKVGELKPSMLHF